MIDHDDATRPSPYTVVEAAPPDAATVAEFNIAMARETEHRDLDAAIVSAGVRAALADPNRGTYYLAHHEGQVVGQTLVTFEWSDWRNGWFWWIQSVYVRPDHRRRGVFRTLHEHVVQRARSHKDVCGIRLYVERDNKTAQATYAQVGMSPTAYLLYEHDWSGPAA